jgi:hypothetical protein|tara:strand:- start:51 stop:593 length:543 start_codon:yes stop_codon:yes gene_type:complete
MKKFIILLLFVPIISVGQSYDFEKLEKATKLKEIPKKISAYKAYNGQVFEVGKNIVYGVPMNENNTYQHIFRMDAFGQFYASRITNKGFEAEIIKFRKGGTKRMGFGIFAVVKTKSGMDRGYFDIDKALRDGEIVSNVMTRTQAISKLKESKELLDLELMTQEEYDIIRTELTPVIKGKK